MKSWRHWNQMMQSISRSRIILASEYFRLSSPIKLKKRRGVALLTVIWGLGAIATLLVPFLSTSRSRLQTAYNISSATRAAFTADGVINIVLISLLTEEARIHGEPKVHAGEATICAFDDAIVSITIEDESGKVDLNIARPNFLQTMLKGFGVNADEAERLADAIIDFRDANTDTNRSSPNGGRPIEPKHAPFESVFELDQVKSLSPQLFRDIAPFVTVYNRRPGVNVQAAPPALFAALSGLPLKNVRHLMRTPYPNNLDRRDVHIARDFQSLQQGGGSGAYLIHVEVVLNDGPSGVREALIETTASVEGRLRIRELHDGRPTNLDILHGVVRPSGMALTPCG